MPFGLSSPSNCPRCGATQVRRSRRHGVLERLPALVLTRPYRCEQCKLRYWGFGSGAVGRDTGRPVTVLDELLRRSCPYCGGDRVAKGWNRDALDVALLMLGIPRVRCRDCNASYRRFFLQIPRKQKHYSAR